MPTRILLSLVVFLALGQIAADATDDVGNRLTYLDSFADPYYVGLDFPKLTTPQWVGEPGAELVITLAIDDMRNNTGHYERHLRPILERLKKIDGRAPVSIMTNAVSPDDPQLQPWLREGVSIEIHTADHPCPCLHGGDFARAKSTYDRCVDQIASIPGNHPVAFRFPCMDSMNTPSPRGFAEILGKTTDRGNFLRLSSSVCVLLTPNDPALPRNIVYEAPGRERFSKYVPFKSFVNVVKDYPYPYIIAGSIWEFPCAIPDDWQGQHLHGNRNPQTARDYLAFAEAAILKQGTANYVFHPGDWIGNELLEQTIDQIDKQFGKRVKFLTFGECSDRLTKHLLCGQPVRDAFGRDNGIRMLDVNHDGFLDVVIGNESLRRTRIWSPDQSRWIDSEFPVPIVRRDTQGQHVDAGVRFGVLRANGMASFVVANEENRGTWHFDGTRWVAATGGMEGLAKDRAFHTQHDEKDQGVRLRDLDGDGICELLVAQPSWSAAFRWTGDHSGWEALPFAPPAPVVDAKGRDRGVRYVDLNADQRADVITSNADGYAVHLFDDMRQGWARTVRQGTANDADAIPIIARNGINYGTWFAAGHMWIQNEHTDRLPDGVDRRSYGQLLGDDYVGPLSPRSGVESLRLTDGFRAELVVSEPLVQDPVSIDWAADGSMWVAEMADYPLGLDDQGQSGGRVRLLQDTDGDGSYDKSTVFLEGLNFPSGVMAWGKGVLVSAAPNLFYAEDRDGDGRADHRSVLFSGFGQGNQQHRINGFARGLDNWIYLANGHSSGTIQSAKTGQTLDIRGRDLRIDPWSGKMETVSGETQHSRTRDDWGNWFGGANHTTGWHYVLADNQLKRNPFARYPATQSALSDTHHVFPVSKLRMHWSGYRPPADGQHHAMSSSCGYGFYRDTLLGPEVAGQFFLCDPTHNLVTRRNLVATGASFRAERAEGESGRDFMASIDPWFRPTMVRTGPDGALWVVDMYRMAIEHPEYMSKELVKQLDLRQGHDRGRIYRITRVDVSPRPMPNLAPLSDAGLVDVLGSPNGWQRDMAQQLLIERHRKSDSQPTPPTSLVEHLERVVRQGRSNLHQIHALAVLDGLKAMDRTLLTTALADGDPQVQRQAARLAGNALLQLSDQAASNETRTISTALRRIGEPDLATRREIAYALGNTRDNVAAEALADLAENASDRHVRAATLASANPANMTALLTRIGRSGDPSTLAELVRTAIGLKAYDAIDHFLTTLFEAPANQLSTGDLSAIATILSQRQRSPDGSQLARILASHQPTLRRIVAHARTTASSADRDEHLRLAAVRLLGKIPADREADLAALTELLAPQQNLSVQLAGLESLVGMDTKQVSDLLLQRWAAATPQLQRAVGKALLTRPAWADAWLNHMARQKLSLQHLPAAQQQQLLKHDNESIRALAETLLAQRATTREEVVQANLAALSTQGAPARGRALFTKHCSTCHRLDGVGNSVGSDLTAVGAKPKRVILESILDPSRAVEDRFVNYSIALSDGRVLNGVLAEETSTTLSLRDADGKVVQVLRSDVEAINNTGRSFMPEGLERELRVQDLADLMAYLQANRVPAKQFPGNSPAVILGVDARDIVLPATSCRIYGPSLVFEAQFKNLGFWRHEDDVAAWTVEVPKGGSYQVVLQYACEPSCSGNTLAIEADPGRLTQKIPATSGWENYRDLTIGELNLDSGVQDIRLYPAVPPSNFVMDLKAVKLVPTKD